MDVARFLGQHPAFSELDADALSRVAGTVQVAYYPAGTVILDGNETDAPMYVIRKGTAETLRQGTLIDLLGEGECFGRAFFRTGPDPMRVRASEDTLCYLLPDAVVETGLAMQGRVASMVSMLRKHVSGEASLGQPVGPRHRGRAGPPPARHCVAGVDRRRGGSPDGRGTSVLAHRPSR